MEFDEARRRLQTFGVPASEDAAARGVRDILARLLCSRAVSLGELQTARDIVERSMDRGRVASEAYVFLAGMFVSLHRGDAAFNLANASNAHGRLLVDACRRNAQDWPAEDADVFGRKMEALWPAAVLAADALDGDVVEKDESTGLWFFAKNRDAVRCVSSLIAERLQPSGEALSDAELDAVGRYRACDGAEFSLTEGQRTAVRAAVAHRLAVVTGGPGTGKTTVIYSILRALLAKTGMRPADIALAAPTGRAAQRMGETLRDQRDMAVCGDADASRQCQAIATLSGSTVQSLLGGYGPDWRHNARNPLPYRLVLVDECSMVDLLLMKALLSALRKDCRLVLLGDRNQLPSVEAGAVLGDLMVIGARGGAHGSAFVELSESCRFSGALKECAEQFKRGSDEAITSDGARLPRAGEKWTATLGRPETENGCFWYGLSGDGIPARVDVLLKEWALAHGLMAGGDLAAAAEAVSRDDEVFGGACTESSRRLFGTLNASRILTVVRGGPFGVEHVNEMLARERLGRGLAQPLIAGGIPVIVTRNTPALNLLNGDVGVTVSRPGRGVHVVFPRGKNVVCVPVALLPEHDLAYATTVHKSQGSEFGDVLVLLPSDASHPLLDRQLVYTGITRARRRTVVVGTRQALDAAVARRRERDTGIAQRYGALDGA